MSKIYNVDRSRAFRQIVEVLRVGDCITHRISECPPETTIRGIAKKLSIHLGKVRVPSADVIVIVRKK